MRTKRLERAAGKRMETGPVCSAVAVALALDELDRIRAVECLPDPESLMQRLQGRDGDFDLLAGVASAYLNHRGFAGGNHA